MLCSLRESSVISCANIAGNQENVSLQITAGAEEVDRQGAARSLQHRMNTFVCSNPLPTQLIKRYVSYGKEFCHPRLTHDAKLRLKDFYLELRRQAAMCPAMPVTVCPFATCSHALRVKTQLHL